MTKPAAGSITWFDLTVPDAERVRQFYMNVVGWTSSEVPMKDYNDFGMHRPEGGDMVAGVCHARGPNADLPPHWLIYITVADVEESARRCRQSGGEVIAGPRALGEGKFCVIRDPAGAVCALYSG